MSIFELILQPAAQATELATDNNISYTTESNLDPEYSEPSEPSADHLAQGETSPNLESLEPVELTATGLDSTSLQSADPTATVEPAEPAEITEPTASLEPIETTMLEAMIASDPPSFITTESATKSTVDRESVATQESEAILHDMDCTTLREPHFCNSPVVQPQVLISPEPVTEQPPPATSADALALDSPMQEPDLAWALGAAHALTSPAETISNPEIAPSFESEPSQSLAQANNAPSPGIELEKIDLNFASIQASGEKDKLFLNPVVHFRLRDRSRLRLTTGFQNFDDARTDDTVTNYPVHLDWSKVLKPGTRLDVGGGIEFFDRLSTSGYFNLTLGHNIPLSVDEAGKPLGNLRVSGTVNFSPLKANAFALENEISRWFIQPRLVWRLDSRTRIINNVKLGFYSDGNTGFFADNRIIHEIPAGDAGVFSIGAEISNHTFEDDLRGRTGYETAQDFLDYRLLLGWRGQIADPLACSLGVDLGRRRVRGDFTNSSAYRAQCSLDMPEQLTLQVGFRYSKFDGSSSSFVDSLEETTRFSASLSKRF
ncbi:MAG: hypothetical protein AAGF93_13650 [Cyanobacteria bacterium P01_H01_bin.105]